MPSYAILRQSHSDSSVFKTVIETLRQAHLWEEGDGPIQEWVALAAGADPRNNFDRAAEFLTEALKERDSLTVLVDEVDAAKLNPLRDNGWSSLLAMLILAFPEVRWVFLVVTGKPPNAPKKSEDDRLRDEIWRTIFHYHGVGRLQEDRGPPLFDGYGLRQAVLSQMEQDDLKRQKARGGASEVAGIPQRPNLAVVLDEETSYNHFEAYMAYKNGFRAHAIASWNEVERLLGKNGILSPSGAGKDDRQREAFALSLEDWYLNFPDQSEQQMSNLENRSKVLPALPMDGTPHRRFVTIGHERRRQDDQGRQSHLRELRTQEYTAHGKKVRRSRQVLCKPMSGFYSVWSKLGLDRAFPEGAPSFTWPPQSSKQDICEESNDGHSSPGRLLQIAEHLLQRCSGLVESANTVTEAVRGAVLATQALELLAGKTPTCSLEALTLKHKFEVLAECQFIGVQHNIEVEQRMKEIARDVRFISGRFEKRTRKASELDAEVAIYSKLVSIFRDYNQFDEEMECLYWERKAMAKLFSHRSGVTGWGKRALWTYLNWLLRKPAWFLFWIAAWWAVGALAFSFCANINPAAWDWKGGGDALGWAIDSFVGVEHVAADPVNAGGNAGALAWVDRILATSGLFHFGVFVSYVYSLIIRK